jgi:hypothetical protein
MPAFEVFLSSTIQDFAPYRRAVKEALDRTEVACFLSEDWCDGYDDTLHKCCDKIRQASGFFLLLGYWYGSIPPGSGKSITHREFDWAMEKWGQQPYPPLAVMTPEPLSEADKDLQSRAASLLPKKLRASKKHSSRLQAFHATVKNTWRTVRFFRNQQDLREYSLISCLKWQGYTPLAAAQENLPPVADNAPVTVTLTDEQLGALGHWQQLTDVQTILMGSAAYPEVPAVALLVWGDEDAGQQLFLRRLLKTKALRGCRPASPSGKPACGHYDLPVLIHWVAAVLGIAAGDEVATPADLADRVAKELKGQPLYFVLDQIHRLAGGVTAFQNDFWRPFYDRLQTLRAQQRIAHRLIAIVVDYSGDARGWESVTCRSDAPYGATSYQQLLEIPRLDPFTKPDIVRWLLEELELADDGTGRLAGIANDVLQDALGKLDPTPRRVFERLRNHPTLTTLLAEKNA